MKRLFLILLGLTGCTATGPIYSSILESKPSQGMAEFIIYHPQEFTGSMGGAPNVKINGQIVCSLPNESFFTAQVKPGINHITSTKLLAVGASDLALNTKPNKRYFIRITWNTDKVWATAGAGLAGEVASEGTSSHSGPFVIELMNEETAKSELSSLHLRSCD